jgi:hypothetical protein
MCDFGLHPESQSLQFCAHVYDGVSLSPGSSQLPLDQLQDTFARRLKSNLDAKVFLCDSFPSEFVWDDLSTLPTGRGPESRLAVAKLEDDVFTIGFSIFPGFCRFLIVSLLVQVSFCQGIVFTVFCFLLFVREVGQ